MRSFLALIPFGALLVGCYVNQPPPIQDPADVSAYQAEDHSQVLSGPPGGGMDPAPGYAMPGPAEQLDPVTTPLTDPEISAALDGQGTWVDDPEYGRVWRPSNTTVGADFTPYESCGHWVYLESGEWSFQCDDYSWGWMAFHYGQWAMLDDGWGWVPGYDWRPAWVDWREGGGYVGWRPSAPVVRDHRHMQQTAGIPPWERPGAVRDHRHREPTWRFVTHGDLERPRIREHVLVAANDAIRVTSATTHPTVRGGASTTRADVVMGPRINSSPMWQHYSPDYGIEGVRGVPGGGYRPNGGQVGGPRGEAISRPNGGRGPTYPSYPSRPSYTPSRPAYNAPVYAPSRPSYNAPVYAPSRPSYNAPSHSSGGSYSAPSHSSGGSYSAPSHSSGGGGYSGGGGGSHSSGGGGGSHSSGGGGGHHR